MSCRCCGAGLMPRGCSMPILSPWPPGERLCESCAIHLLFEIAVRATARFWAGWGSEERMAWFNRAQFVRGQLEIVGALARAATTGGAQPQEVSCSVH